MSYRTDMRLTPEMRPYLEEAKQQDSFECPEDQQSQADLLSDFVPGSNWAVWIGWSSQLSVLQPLAHNFG